MAKIHTTLSIEESVLKKAKELQINISGAFEKYLRDRVVPTKNDLPEENLKVVCSECNREIDEGFKCEELNRIYCNDCQEKVKMIHHPHDRRGEHMHIKW